MTKGAIVSPRLAALERELVAGRSEALGLFWQEITERGAPLIEPVEGDEKHYYVTFLWRDTGAQGPLHNVVVFARLAAWKDPQKNQMTRLLDTDLWYRTYRVQADLRCTYLLSPNDPLTPPMKNWVNFISRMTVDPLNPHVFVHRRDPDIPDERELQFSILELPEAPPQPWNEPREGVARGHITHHRLRSEILGNERSIWVYTPPGYTPEAEPYGLLLLFDGWAYLETVPTPTIIENMLSEEKIPPLVAVFVDSLKLPIRNRELPCYPPFVDFLTQELFPWLRQRYRVTEDPARVIVGGSSYGGLAAAFVSLRAPEMFGNVLSMSGSFWWDKDPEDGIPQEWLTQQFLAHPRLPLRFYFEVGTKERSGFVDMIPGTRHLRDILHLKGYEVYYHEFNGGHEYIVRRGALANGLLTLAGPWLSDAS